jgi:hypothetical protein
MEVHELARKMDEFHREMREDMAVLKRGVYGDERNNVKGLLRRQDEDDDRLTAMEDRVETVERKAWRINILIGLVWVAIGAFWEFIKGKA